MPAPGGTQQINRKRASITFMDFQGNTLPQSIRTSGGDISMGDVLQLADAIAECSNACYIKAKNDHEREWNVQDMRFRDEAQSSVENVIVITLLHDTDSRLNEEVLIPAYDASLLESDMTTVKVTDARIIAVANAALAIANDDDNALNPDNYHGWTAYKSLRRVSKSKGNKNLNLPLPVEPDTGDPDEGPGDNP